MKNINQRAYEQYLALQKPIRKKKLNKPNDTYQKDLKNVF
jgi:hypothetical protein